MPYIALAITVWFGMQDKFLEIGVAYFLIAWGVSPGMGEPLVKFRDFFYKVFLYLGAIIYVKLVYFKIQRMTYEEMETYIPSFLEDFKAINSWTYHAERCKARRGPELPESFSSSGPGFTLERPNRGCAVLGCNGVSCLVDFRCMG